MECGADVDCPYCGRELWIAVDPGGGSSQRFIADCQVCCRPIQLRAHIDNDGDVSLTAATEDEFL